MKLAITGLRSGFSFGVSTDTGIQVGYPCPVLSLTSTLGAVHLVLGCGRRSVCLVAVGLVWRNSLLVRVLSPRSPGRSGCLGLMLTVLVRRLCRGCRSAVFLVSWVWRRWDCEVIRRRRELILGLTGIGLSARTVT